MDKLIYKRWYSLPTAEASKLLDVDPTKGLDHFEAQRRLIHYGKNRLAQAKGTSPIRRFLLQFHQPLVYILLLSGLVSAIFSGPADAMVIFSITIVNACIGFFQDTKAVQAMDALSHSLTIEAKVLRTGTPRRINAELLVPGDVVLLKSGDKIPADLRLIACKNFQVDESLLTGESLPVEKTSIPVPCNAILAERRSMAYAGTMATLGSATGLVTTTASATEIGRIAALTVDAGNLQTPLTHRMTSFSTILLVVIMFLALATFGAGIYRGQTVAETFMAAVTLAVGAIPEGLPAAMTIILAIGVGRMARRRAVIRKLSAVETLGEATVICSDKTGTLTENQMTVQQVKAGNIAYSISGTGYALLGTFNATDNSLEPAANTALAACMRAGLLCNDAHLVIKNGQPKVYGDSTEAALLIAAAKFGLDQTIESYHFPRLDTIPFESGHQYMATLHDTSKDTVESKDTNSTTRLVFLKGAAEVIVERCTMIMDATGKEVPIDRTALHQSIETMANDGLRVIACARGVLTTSTTQITEATLPSHLVLLGLQGIIDPPRPAAINAVAICRQAGVAVKVITGDHAVTALAIARRIGITEPGTAGPSRPTAVLTGTDIADLDDAALSKAVASVAVFARISPEQKLRLVEALQTRGEIVAMTGDGVNDAPALKQADIGVAMGLGGTDAAREAADMVLTNDDFATITAAIEEGRAVLDNLRKFLVWALPTNLGEGLVILLAVFMALPLPMLPAQILWINMTTAGSMGLALAFEPQEPGLMNRPPRRRNDPLLDWPLLMRISLMGLMLLSAAFGMFELGLSQGMTLTEARTAAVNIFAIISTAYLFNCRSLFTTALVHNRQGNPWALGGAGITLALQLALTYLPWMQRWFHTAPLTTATWLIIAAAAAIAFGLVEAEKALTGRFLRRRRT
ncbi:putative cation-transporting ATPase F [Desulfovibrionales bacterium]